MLKAHEALLEATDLLKVLRNLRNDGCAVGECKELSQETSELSFMELGGVWQAPLYEIVLNYQQDDKTLQNGGLVYFTRNLQFISVKKKKELRHLAHAQNAL